MKKFLLFSMVLFFILYAVRSFAAPKPETIVTLTAGDVRVKVAYQILQHSEYIRGMFEHKMQEYEQLKNSEPFVWI